MDSTVKNALALLGLDSAEDQGRLWQHYIKRLEVLQTALIAATDVSDQQVLQAQLAKLVGAYQLLKSGTPPTLDRNAATIYRTKAADVVTQTEASGAMPAARIEPGVLLMGRYRIESVLGDGGMGRVFAARDQLKDEEVAIKVLRSELLSSVAARSRFLSEAKVSCRLAHPNIIRVYDVGIADSRYFFTMERLRGQSLRDRMHKLRATGKVCSLEEAAAIAEQLLDALNHAHRYIVHRDLKPENIWLDENGTVKLMDFGIARAVLQSGLTRTGMNMGTAYYMAPEQHAESREVDWRADQYSFGVLMYELLAGRVPMGAVQPLEQIRRDVPRTYARAIMRAMSPRVDARFASLRELQNVLAVRREDDVPGATFNSLSRAIALGTIAGAMFAYLDNFSLARINGLMYPSGIAAGIGTALIIEFCEAFFRSRFRMHIVAALSATVLWIAVVLFVAQSLSGLSHGLVMMLCGSMGASGTDYITRRWRVAEGRFRLQTAIAGALFGSMFGLLLLAGSPTIAERNYWLTVLSGLVPGMIISMASLRRRLWSNRAIARAKARSYPASLQSPAVAGRRTGDDTHG